MKKIAIILALIMILSTVLSFTACSTGNGEKDKETVITTTTAKAKTTTKYTEIVTTPTDDDDDILVGAYVTLEALIGEFDCTTLIGYIELCPMPKEPFKEGFRPLDDLPEFVKWFKNTRNKE